MESLRLLLPNPILWDTNDVQGKLLVYGDLENNRLQFSFLFKTGMKIFPLIVFYTDGKAEYKSSLSIIREDANSVESYIFNPAFLISDGFCITGITCMVTVREGVIL